MALKTKKKECKHVTFGCSDQVTADSMVFTHSAENLCFHKYQEIRKKERRINRNSCPPSAQLQRAGRVSVP